MSDKSVCAPLLAKSDALTLTTNSPHEASVTDGDNVINTNTDSNQVEGVESVEELTNGLLTDDYCHVCDAVLLFKSQRLSHYEGKKHAQKLRVYLRTKTTEKMKKKAAGIKSTPADKERFCELCNMVFSSPVVARSHYDGKVHTKNLRKQGLQPSVLIMDSPSKAPSKPHLGQDPVSDVQKSSPEDGVESPDTTATTTVPGPDVDLTDPNRYCAMCSASFNNPQMAVQHYNGRKHHRNQNRHQLMKELGTKVQQDNSLMCQLCGVQFNSVEMFQAHMQGNKHQVREKKVQILCKSQQKVYHTFADELTDYIEIQKARGIAQKPSVLPAGAKQKDSDWEREGKVFPEWGVAQKPKPLSNFPPSYNPPHPSGSNRSKGCHPLHLHPHWPPQGFLHSGSLPVFPGPASPMFRGHSLTRKRPRKPPRSQSHETWSSSDSSSYSSSSSSSTSSSSDSGDTKYHHREKRRIRRSRREREKSTKEQGSDKEEKKRKRRRRERHQELDGGRRGESGGSEEERRRKGSQSLGRNKSREKKACTVLEAAVEDSWKQEEVLHDKTQDKVNVEQQDSEQDEHGRAKIKRERKKGKEDTRTEEEKLWDDSILGF